ncbi:MAG: LacI family DNA-binding transcriptional regulator, partial [Desulfomonilaceae bacterium]
MSRIIKDEGVTIKDIARIAKVSPSTVSLVMNDKPGVHQETRYRV